MAVSRVSFTIIFCFICFIVLAIGMNSGNCSNHTWSDKSLTGCALRSPFVILNTGKWVPWGFRITFHWGPFGTPLVSAAQMGAREWSQTDNVCCKLQLQNNRLVISASRFASWMWHKNHFWSIWINLSQRSRLTKKPVYLYECFRPSSFI